MSRNFFKSIVILSMVLLIPFSSKAEQLSPSVEISLITASPGEELYSSFGHSAILIRDTTNKIFKMYNYGTFDFETPNFYWKFARGRLLYELNVEDPRELMFIAKMENRNLTMQVLNLSLTQAQKFYDYLETNALPENKYYKYDFLLDNCSTRLRDALIAACGDDLNFNLKETPSPITFREIIDTYLDNKKYIDLGIDLGMGVSADAIVAPQQQMFMPNGLKDIFAGATNRINGEVQQLVTDQAIILPNTPEEKNDTILMQPWFHFSILFLLIGTLTVYQNLKNKDGFWVDAVLFSVVGLLGLTMLFLWIASEHQVMGKNYNLLWAFPLHLVAITMLLMKKNLKRVSAYFLVNFFAICYILVFWKFVPQELNVSCIPILLVLALRSMHIYYRIDKNIVRWKL